MQGDKGRVYEYDIQTDMQKIGDQWFHGPVKIPLRELHPNIQGHATPSITLRGEDAQAAAQIIGKLFPILVAAMLPDVQLSVSNTSRANLRLCLDLGIAGHCGSPRQINKSRLQRQGDIVILKVIQATEWYAGIVLKPAYFNPITPLKSEMHNVQGYCPRKQYL